MYTIGYDIGSSFVKGVLWDEERGEVAAHVTVPDREMPIRAEKADWAEQDPEMWWEAVKAATQRLIDMVPGAGGRVRGIGVSYQMHGLVLLDRDGKVLRPSIIWCDSRATGMGKELEKAVGEEAVRRQLLNSPGNFTVSKLAWVIRNEPETASRIRWVMLPGDWIAYQLTGMVSTTVCGLSEGMLWNFKDHVPHVKALEAAGADPEWIPPVAPNPGDQGVVGSAVGAEMGFAPGARVLFRGGDQPMNAYGLGVDGPGMWAASAGTSGVLYRVDPVREAEPTGMANRFAHIGHSAENPAIGTLLCLNGAGIAYAWLRRVMFAGQEYAAINEHVAAVPAGADGVMFHPFGNGAERMLDNRQPGAGWSGIHFNRHGQGHLARAVMEGIVFAFVHGMRHVDPSLPALPVIRAPHAGLFRSELFASMLSTLAGADVQLHAGDGATGAAQGASVALGASAIKALDSNAARDEPGVLKTHSPDPSIHDALESAYSRWKDALPSQST
jgi:xylulokinase